ncbi:MAG: phosphatase PAP2 family protein [Patescibacteria group bacterium]
MLNWYFVGIIAALAAAGFYGLDEFSLKTIKKFRREFHPVVLQIFNAISFTPFVIATLFVIPFFFVLRYLDFFSAAALTLTCLLATGGAFTLKYIFRRVRPLGHQTYLGKIDSAFPSAHTAGSFASAFVLAFFWPAWSAPFFVLAALVAFSRIYLELHFFSDVMGGILLAYLFTVLTLDSTLLTFIGF